MVTQIAVINFIPGGVPPHVKVSQGDTAERVLQFQCYFGDASYSIPSGSTVIVNGAKPGGTVFTRSATFSGNVVTLPCAEGMTDTAGKIPCEVMVTTSDGTISSANFVLEVEGAPVNDAAVSASDLSSMTELSAAASQAATNARQSELEAYEYAAGARDAADEAVQTLLSAVKYSDIVNGFTQTVAGEKVLDAVAGKTLNDTIQAAVDTLIHGNTGSIVGGFKTIAYDASAVDSFGTGAVENFIMHCRTAAATDSLSNAFRDAWTSTTPILTLNNVYWTMLSYAYGGSVRFQFAFTHAAETPMFAFRTFAWWGSVTWSNWQVVGAPDGAKQTVTTTSTATDLSDLTTAQLQQIVFNSDNVTVAGNTNQVLIYPFTKIARIRLTFDLSTVTTGAWRQVCRVPVRPKQTLYFSVIAGSVGSMSNNSKMDASINSNGILSIFWGAEASGKRAYMADLIPLG